MEKTLLFFTASWCGNCRAIKPIVEAEAPQNGYKVKYVDVESDEGAEMAEDYKVRSLPALIALDEQDAEIRRAYGNTAWIELRKN